MTLSVIFPPTQIWNTNSQHAKTNFKKSHLPTTKTISVSALLFFSPPDSKIQSSLFSVFESSRRPLFANLGFYPFLSSVFVPFRSVSFFFLFARKLLYSVFILPIQGPAMLSSRWLAPFFFSCVGVCDTAMGLGVCGFETALVCVCGACGVCSMYE